jgi:Zn-dependent M16 (insulinase) family peptidase
MTIEEFVPGQLVHGFRVERIDQLPAINATMIRLSHERTGARFMHLYRDDDNHLFSVGFRTPPEDSTGVAHILEHTALCGSEHFPVRDPFFSMLKRSLNSFMNAMTASDWTLYPFSSMNRRDFRNLLDIYLDAAFFPLLSERDFSQEGHRLEFSELDNPASPLEYKGIVYNEMKGAMSDPSSLLSRRLDKHLFPTTTYHHNSGGEPEDIPQLTWQQLRDFHARYYHPSNAYFFTSGNLDLAEILKVVEANVLSRFERIEPDSEVPPEQRLTQPLKVSEGYPLDAGEPLEKRSMVQLGWLCGDINDSFERLAMSVLSSLLLGNPAAPLYKALLDSGLGANLAPGVGYHDDNRTTYFAAGMQGTDPDKHDMIETLILETLEQVAREGFSRERIEGVLHRLEFANREVTGDSYPYSLLLLMRLIGPWIHGGDPLEALDFEENLKLLREKVAAGNFFGGLIRERLLDNPHRVSLLLEPDTEMGPRQEEKVRSELDKIAAALVDEEKQALVDRALELKQAQEAPEDLSCLPTLELSDIPERGLEIPAKSTEQDGIRCHWFAQPSNGIASVALNFGLAGLSDEDLRWLPLLGSLLTQLGAGERDYLQMAEALEAATGGIFARTSILDDPQELGHFNASFEVKGKALIRNIGPLFELLGDFLLRSNLSDQQRIHTVLNQLKVSLENSVPQSGHTYAARSAAAGLSAVAHLREQWSGLSQLILIREWAAKPVAELDELVAMLQQLVAKLFTRTQLQTAVTVEEKFFSDFEVPLADLLKALPQVADVTASGAADFAAEAVRRGLVWSVPVNYVARVFRTVNYSHPDNAALTVLSKLLRAEFLHREIREMGGAYGGLASHSAEAGQFSMLSYRDPHLTRTLGVYEDAIRWAVAGNFSAEAVKESILAVFSDLDKPLSPGGCGSQEFANIRQGMSHEMRNNMRQQLLRVDVAKLQEVAGRYLKDCPGAVAVLAGDGALQQANEKLEEPLEIVKI